jgi:hypothetical protein
MYYVTPGRVEECVKRIKARAYRAGHRIGSKQYPGKFAPENGTKPRSQRNPRFGPIHEKHSQYVGTFPDGPVNLTRRDVP